mmetsp:Transcript_6751/g.19024  ORF Transcript_6751/g.19024 Transcript_6751/m.19024 type:complete len:118 (+) Transcript_6751:648-1001(+)
MPSSKPSKYLRAWSLDIVICSPVLRLTGFLLSVCLTRRWAQRAVFSLPVTWLDIFDVCGERRLCVASMACWGRRLGIRLFEVCSTPRIYRFERARSSNVRVVPAVGTLGVAHAYGLN